MRGGSSGTWRESRMRALDTPSGSSSADDVQSGKGKVSYMAKSEPLASTECAQIIGQLLRQWSAKDAPISVQIAFCEELKLAAEACQADPEHGWWFSQLCQEAEDSISALRRLSKKIIREAENAKDGLDNVANNPPGELRQAVQGV